MHCIDLGMHCLEFPQAMMMFGCAALESNERPKSPTDPMSFPPGLIPRLVRETLEVDPPYTPLSTRDVDRAGLPEPSQPDAYLTARLDKFHAELKVRDQCFDFLLAAIAAVVSYFSWSLAVLSAVHVIECSCCELIQPLTK